MVGKFHQILQSTQTRPTLIPTRSKKKIPDGHIFISDKQEKNDHSQIKLQSRFFNNAPIEKLQVVHKKSSTSIYIEIDHNPSTTLADSLN